MDTRVVETSHTRGRMPSVGDTTVAYQGVIKRRIKCTRVSVYGGQTVAHWVMADERSK